MLHGNRKLLIVEDNFDDEKLILRAIQRMDLEIDIEVVRDGLAAVQRLCEGSHPLPDLVLLDWKLPLMMGSEVLKQLRSDDRCKDVPVVVFSSSDRPDDSSECSELGGTDYVVKPVEYEAFLAAVQRIVRRYFSVSSQRPTVAPNSAEYSRTYMSGPDAIS